MEENVNEPGLDIETEEQDVSGLLEKRVLDVRNGLKERILANFILKQNNIARGSKFFRPSSSVLGFSYNTSNKK